MNYNKWNKHIVAPVLALKLCEEAAEVGTEISDAYMGKVPMSDEAVKRLHEELDHVQHLVDTLREKFPLT